MPSRFDGAGTALHKIYAGEHTDMDAFHALVEALKADDLPPFVAVPAAPKAADAADDTIDKEALLADWGAMTDTHEFCGMLRKHKVGRLQALRLAEGQFARRVAPRCSACWSSRHRRRSRSCALWGRMGAFRSTPVLWSGW